MRKHILLLAVMIMMVVVSGCATTSTMRDAQNGQITAQDIPSLNKTKSISVNVTTANQDYAKERNILSDDLIAKMREDGYIVTSNNNAADQKLEVNIIYLKRVSKEARFFLGVLAGTAEVNVIVNVAAVERNGQFILDTTAMDWTGFAGSTEQTLAKVAERIAQAVQGRKNE